FGGLVNYWNTDTNQSSDAPGTVSIDFRVTDLGYDAWARFGQAYGVAVEPVTNGKIDLVGYTFIKFNAAAVATDNFGAARLYHAGSGSDTGWGTLSHANGRKYFRVGAQNELPALVLKNESGNYNIYAAGTAKKPWSQGGDSLTQDNYDFVVTKL